jgi:hypothetical protein
MMDKSSRPLASWGERGFASKFFQSMAPILMRSICPSLLYFSIRTPEHPDNHTIAANPHSRPRLFSQPFKPMPSQSFKLFYISYYRKSLHIFFKKSITFLWPGIFCSCLGAHFPAEPFVGREMGRKPAGSWQVIQAGRDGGVSLAGTDPGSRKVFKASSTFSRSTWVS